MATIRGIYHPNAYLKSIKNVRSGLAARSKILDLLDDQAFSATKIAKEAKVTYSVAIHHLRLLGCEGIIVRKGSRRYVWLATGTGQRRLS